MLQKIPTMPKLFQRQAPRRRKEDVLLSLSQNQNQSLSLDQSPIPNPNQQQNQGQNQSQNPNHQDVRVLKRKESPKRSKQKSMPKQIEPRQCKILLMKLMSI